MNDIEQHLEQSPVPGAWMIRYRGDVLAFTLRVPPDWEGEAFLRTNLGCAHVRHEELVRAVEHGEAVLARDWRDVPMTRQEPGIYTAVMPMTQTGRFEAKAFWLPAPGEPPRWPTGGNTVVKVEPADYAAGNAVYSAFIRQFGPHRSDQAVPSQFKETIQSLEQSGYAVIPLSGSFRDFAKYLDVILGEMGFSIVQLLPVHPIPTTYARMGRFGSPFAALDYFDVDHGLAEFDRRTTPLEQFDEVVDAVHARGGRVFMDIPVNHTGWASRLQIEHPEWFVRDQQQRFKSPGAWGVTWEDLSELDYSHKVLWITMAEVFLFWARRGVDGFRCDAGYKVPYAVWVYIVAKVRLQYPDTLFFLEGLGGKISTMEALLGDANLDWAYSELFQDEDRTAIERQLPGYWATSRERGLLIHFAETHDNNRLAARSPAYARLRVALSVLASQGGGYGIANGVEWLATEKIDVHGAPSLRWGADDNMVPWIRRLNALARLHPCFEDGAHVCMIQCGDGNALALLRERGGKRVLGLVNLCDDKPQTVVWRRCDYGDDSQSHSDLLSGAVRELNWSADEGRVDLKPGEALCLSVDGEDAAQIERVTHGSGPLPAVASVERRRLAAAWFDATGMASIPPAMASDLDKALALFKQDPTAPAMYAFAETEESQPPLPVLGAVRWCYPSDLKRVVMLPPGRALCVMASHPFQARLVEGVNTRCRRRSFEGEGGCHVAVFPALADSASAHALALHVTVYDPQGVRHGCGTVMGLSDGRQACARQCVKQAAMPTAQAYAVLCQEHSTIAQVRAEWGRIESQYDALLAANLHPDYPTDRHIMLTRCRAWLVYRGHWQDLDGTCTERFRVENARAAVWRFRVPLSGGQTVVLDARVNLDAERNRVSLVFKRIKNGSRVGTDGLPASEPVTLILRPDIEDRKAHEKTKASNGPELHWPQAIENQASGFVFRPAPERVLTVGQSSGSFSPEPEWLVDVPHPFEADRGLGDCSDLFSPGFFSVDLQGGEQTTLTAAVTGQITPGTQIPEIAAGREETAAVEKSTARETLPLSIAMREAMAAFVVRRDAGKTVIAGYPWFLDWGRDTLIVLRGMIAAGWPQDARAIMREFARFEEQGTLPNMIHGNDVSNRDTSDAPLWLLVACADLIAAEGDDKFLHENCGGRTVRDALLSIGRHYRDGTPNGIKMDADSGLIFSPSHFTWMDTNHPAGTPRLGYPVEIQALWHAGLRLLSRIDPEGNWGVIAALAHRSAETLYPVESRCTGQTERYLSDCLHAHAGQKAAQAEADDALRPNQLLAITLGLVQDKGLCAAMLRACETLLVPGAIRSLADRSVRYALPVQGPHGELNDPHQPYWGAYRGDEDTRRKPAYHNGTAWTWLYPSYAEALVLVYGDEALPLARAYAAAGEGMINVGCLGHVPEVADGDAPHTPRGCGAQAWGASELFRVLDSVWKHA